MRTTVTLAKDVAAAVARLRRERGIGVSEAVNELARRGLTARGKRVRFRQEGESLGEMLIDVTNVGEAIELAEAPERR
jgi:Ribbon-helix-helix protein, copG family